LKTATYPIEEVQRLYKRVTELELWRADALERMAELEIEADNWHKAEHALSQLADAADELGKVARKAQQLNKDDVVFNDFAAYRNVMQFHGIEPYAKPKRKKRAA
jgi:hypothetical protein